MREAAGVSALVASARDLSLSLQPGELLSRHTTFRIGGPAEFSLAPGMPASSGELPR